MSAKEQKIQFTRSGGDFTVGAEGYRLDFSGAEATGRMFDAFGQEVLAISFVPPVNGQLLADFTAGKVSKIANTVGVSCRASGLKLAICFGFHEQGFTYFYHISDIPTLNCFAPGTLRGSFDIAHNFGPDLERFDIPRRVATAVQISSRQAEYQKFFELDQGNYMIPPYLLGLGRHNQPQIVGVGLLDVPETTIPFDAKVTIDQLNLQFDYGQFAQSGLYASPRVGVYLADGRTGLLAAYRQMIHLTSRVRKTHTALWWDGPIYTTWGDQVYKKHLEQGKFTSEAGSGQFLSAELVDSALEKLKQNGLNPCTIVLDEGWSTNLGDWQADDSRFGGSLAQFIDDKQQAGYRVVLYFNPFLVNPDSTQAAQHPEFLVKDDKGKLRMITHGGTNYCLFDWTNPQCRDFIRDRVTHMLSAEGLNADGIKVAGTKYLPEPGDLLGSTGVSPVSEKHKKDTAETAVLPDKTASYGRGERYLFNVLRDLHGFVKAAKPSAPIYLACMNPLFEQFFDIIRLGNTSEVNHDVYVQRSATCSALMPGRIIDTDDWAAFQKVIGATTFAKAVCGVPNIFSAFYRGEGRLKVQGAMGGCPVRIEDEQYRVLSAAWKLYEFSRGADRGNLRVDFDRMEFSAGQPGDKCFVRTYQGANILAVYRGRDIYLASLLDAKAIINLPSGFEIERIERIDRDGAKSDVEWKKCLGDKAIFKALSSRDQTYYYQIQGVQ